MYVTINLENCIDANMSTIYLAQEHTCSSAGGAHTWTDLNLEFRVPTIRPPTKDAPLTLINTKFAGSAFQYVSRGRPNNYTPAYMYLISLLSAS